MNITSALFSGVVLAKPVMEARTIYEQRSRVLASFVCAGAAFGLFMTAFIMTTMDIVLQIDAQGFLRWSTMLTTSSVFVVFAAILGLVAKAVFPKPPQVVTLPVHEILEVALQALANHLPRPEQTSQTSREMAREMSEVEEEREKIRDRARGDFDLDQIRTPAFTH